MAQNNGDLLKRLRATFRVEADEHLRAILSGLRALEGEAAPARRAAVIESVFRETHSLKGAARAVNLPVIESICQPMESAFAAIKQARLQVSSGLIEVLREAAEAIQAMVARPDLTAGPRGATVDLVQRLDAALAADATAAPTPAAAPPPPTGATPAVAAGVDAPLPQTVRVGTARLDAAMRHVEELLQPRLAAGQRLAEVRGAAAELAAWKDRRLRLQPVLRALDTAAAQEAPAGGGADVAAVLEYLDAEQVHLKTLEDRVGRVQRALGRDLRTLGAMIEALHRDTREMQLLPFAWLAEGFARVVGELAREQAKEVDFVLEGGDIEIDRRILEDMKAPLIHMLRNGVDHGIETPAERIAAGKPRRGTMTLTAAQGESGRVALRIADDGAGIDAEKVKAAARRLGVASGEDVAGAAEAEVSTLLFRSGVSTSAILTDVSGRGLGLAIVREKVERLGGSVTVVSELGKGTRFQIDLPLTVALFRGVLLRAGDLLCVVPAASVERVLRADIATIKTVRNCETLEVAGQAVSLVRLAAILERPGPVETPGNGRVLAAVVQHAARRVAFQVEAVLGEQEVLVKPLGPQLVRVRNVAGACMLGSGETVPVLSVPDLLKSASRYGTAAVARPAPDAAAAERQSILVAEDSVTSRSLLKGILEAAGYRVSTAVDGADAYATLKTADFNLLVSDVEMPRMDGFELTARVRADRRLSELPVVLVTALASREHRERGIDVGANAYIVKSDFDQSNLLEVIQRLVGTDRRGAE